MCSYRLTRLTRAALYQIVRYAHIAEPGAYRLIAINAILLIYHLIIVKIKPGNNHEMQFFKFLFTK